MRTWSVKGTALALCTRSSSLSIRTRTSMGVSLVAQCAGSLFKRVREPENLALVRICGADLRRSRAVRERPHQTLRAQVLRALLGPQEGDQLTVARPGRRVPVRDQPTRVRPVRIGHPERAVVHVHDLLSVRRPRRHVAVQPDRVRVVSIRADERELPLFRLRRPVLDVHDPVARRRPGDVRDVAGVRELLRVRNVHRRDPDVVLPVVVLRVQEGDFVVVGREARRGVEAVRHRHVRRAGAIRTGDGDLLPVLRVPGELLAVPRHAHVVEDALQAHRPPVGAVWPHVLHAAAVANRDSAWQLGQLEAAGPSERPAEGRDVEGEDETARDDDQRPEVALHSCGETGAPGLPDGNISLKRRATGSGTSSSTLPPNDATSLTPLEETKLYCGFDIRYTVSTSGARVRLRWFIWNSHSKSEITRRPFTIVVAPQRFANSTTSSEKTSTSTLSWSRSASSRKATRSSTENIVCLWLGSRTTPTTTRSKISAERLMMSRWPSVTGS